MHAQRGTFVFVRTEDHFAFTSSASGTTSTWMMLKVAPIAEPEQGM